MSPRKVIKKPFWLIYFLGFLWALSYALPLYSQSSFVESIVGQENIGLVFVVMSFVGLLAIYYYSEVLKRFGNYYSAVGILLLNMIMVLGVFFSSGYMSLVFYTLLATTFSLFVINNDIFLESISDDRTTGRIRTTMLTIINIGVLIAPIIMGNILGDTDNFKIVFLIGGIVIFPAFMLLLYRKKDVIDSKVSYRKRSFKALKKLFETHPDILRVMATDFALRFFYATMVLYLPIVLHEYIGFDWSTIGMVLTMMLLPFVLLQMPAGKIADKYLGEKEMIISGIVIMAVFSTAVALFKEPSVMVWGFILFMTRVGAALLESMNETYFFKQVSKQDMDLIDMFRDIRPFAWLTAAAVTWLFLRVFDIPSVFLLLSGVLLIALWPAVLIKDTK
ncbi:MAG: MFS transporter [Patescibacteria group bacterium]